MGTQAKRVFEEQIQLHDIKVVLVKETSVQINNKQSVKFVHLKTNSFNVFFMPHFTGNLHISNEFKTIFEIFKDECCSYINQTTI
jgi:hypothetical protein